MSKDTSAADIGNAVCDAFSVANKYYKNLKEEATINKKRITLQDGSTLIIREPKDSHFVDMEDCGAAEIYQCYEYRPNMDAEATAMFFIGTAPELDCKLSKEAIEQGWEEIYGNADEFLFEKSDANIFRYRVEMRNGKYHKLSYFLKHEEDLLLECGMQVNQPNRRKKTDEKLTEQFHDFVKGCTIESVESSDSMSLL